LSRSPVQKGIETIHLVLLSAPRLSRSPVQKGIETREPCSSHRAAEVE